MPTACLPRLDNKETTAPIDPIPSYGQTLRHSCFPAYLAAERVYEYLDRRKDRKRSTRLKYCRTDAWFCRHKETGEVRVASNACHLRWCPVCSQSRRNYIAHSVAEWTGSADHPKFLTLTLKHSDAPLEWQIQNLYNYFRELRRRKEFRHRVKGGIWFFQIKKSKTDGLWHPHLHCLVEGLYLPKRELSRVWSQITFGSFIVDVRPIHDPQAAANDAAKYAACPGSLVGLSQTDALELVNSMHRRRICGTWGTGRAVSLRPAKQTSKDEWQSIGRWDVVMNLRTDNPNARAILNAWRDKQPLVEGINCLLWSECELIPDGIPEEQLVFDEVYKTGRSPP